MKTVTGAIICMSISVHAQATGRKSLSGHDRGFLHVRLDAIFQASNLIVSHQPLWKPWKK